MHGSAAMGIATAVTSENVGTAGGIAPPPRLPRARGSVAVRAGLRCGRSVLAEQRHVSVTITGDEEIGLTGDDTLLRQMVGNLLDNAIRHAAPGGRVLAALERYDDHVTLRITNDGDGIPSDHQSRVFERFVRLGDSEGAGLGLPIARWIAAAHGGTAVLEHSEPGRTTFAVRLPLEPSGDRPTTSSPEPAADIVPDAAASG